MSAMDEYKRVCAVVRGKEYWAVQRSDVADAADAALAELEAEVAQRDRMLAAIDTQDLNGEQTGGAPTAPEFLADLRARAKEGEVMKDR